MEVHCSHRQKRIWEILSSRGHIWIKVNIEFNWDAICILCHQRRPNEKTGWEQTEYAIHKIDDNYSIWCSCVNDPFHSCHSSPLVKRRSQFIAFKPYSFALISFQNNQGPVFFESILFFNLTAYRMIQVLTNSFSSWKYIACKFPPFQD